MPALVAIIFQTLAALLPSLIAKGAAALGFGLVTYNLGMFGVDQVFQLITQYASGIPTEIAAVLLLSNFDVALSIVLAAYSTALTLRGLTSAGSVTKLRNKGFS